MPPNLIFSHPAVENRFRRAVAGEKEVGGWLLCNYWKPGLWPTPHFSRRELANSLGREHVASLSFIEGFMVVPNKHGHPKGHWQAWHYERAKEVAQATGQAHECHIIHFHTHPSGDPKSSRPADIAFAAASCSLGVGMAEFCIVTSHPLRIWPYQLRWGDAASPHTGSELECGQFWTWRMKGLGRFRR